MSKQKDIVKILQAFKDAKILVVGDLMLDHYIMGDVERISPEAPVPVVDVSEDEYTLGGAGNVIRNLSSIGCKVHVLSTVGTDDHGQLLKNLLSEHAETSNVICDPTRRTTRKTRIVTESGAQLLRIDREDRVPFNIEPHHIEIPRDIDIIIVSDYAKGMITDELMQLLKSSGIPIIVDPKPINSSMYNDVFMITPNLKEYREMIEYPDVKYTLKTLGKDGMVLIDHKNKQDTIIEGREVKVFNVSGAGDTVISIMAACMAVGLNDDYVECATIANLAAGLVVTKPGTATITDQELMRILDKVLNRSEQCII